MAWCPRTPPPIHFAIASGCTVAVKRISRCSRSTTGRACGAMAVARTTTAILLSLNGRSGHGFRTGLVIDHDAVSSLPFGKLLGFLDRFRKVFPELFVRSSFVSHRSSVRTLVRTSIYSNARQYMQCSDGITTGDQSG